KPAAERVPVALLAKRADVHNHSLKHFLEDVGNVRLTEVPPATPVKDKRGIERDQAFPGRRFVRLDTLQQAARRGIRRARLNFVAGGLAGTAHGICSGRRSDISLTRRDQQVYQVVGWYCLGSDRRQGIVESREYRVLGTSLHRSGNLCNAGSFEIK